MACQWKNSSTEMISYHDKEWGVPTHDDQKLFEYLLLESMQAGLSWALILRKRETLRSCFANFSPEKVAAFTEEDIERIMHTENMIKSERKIRAMIQNAKAFLALQKEEGSFDSYLCIQAIAMNTSFSQNNIFLEQYSLLQQGILLISIGRNSVTDPLLPFSGETAIFINEKIGT